MVVLLMKGKAGLGISGSRIKTMSAWNMAKVSVQPVGKVVNLTAPEGDWTVVRSHNAMLRVRWS